LKDIHKDYIAKITYLAAGLSIGALLSVLLAPQSGDDTREWIAGKCEDGMDAVHAKVQQTRGEVGELLQEGQEQIGGAVEQGRKAFRKAKAAAG
jgi:gas vesicle protein